MANSEVRVLVTGATGFLGSHIVRALLAPRGDAGTPYRVRALVRTPSPDLDSLGVEQVKGDVTDGASLDAAMEGITHVVHAAGLVSRDPADTRAMMQVHVVGTRLVVEAACRAGVQRVVHISTSGTMAVGDDPQVVFHEGDPVPLLRIAEWPYYLSKLLAERAAFDARRLTAKEAAGPAIITLNPSLTLGPGDLRGSSTVDVRRFLDRQIPMVPAGGISFVDVRDVAAAALAALEKGRDGERYLLGALNLTMADFFSRLSEVSGVAGPALNMRVPKQLTRLGVGFLERVANAVGVPPPVTSVEAEMASAYWYVDPRKAIEELGFSPREPMRTLLDTVRDLRGGRIRATA